MSAEHGHHSEETTFTTIITSIIMMILFIPQALGEVEKVVQAVVNPEAEGHHAH